MGARAKYEIPAPLKEAQERFKLWRSSQTGRRPIPESLWALASELARQYVVFRTAQVLRLDYTKLKRCTPEASVETPASQPAFVELIATPTTHPNGNAPSKWKGHAAACASNGRVLRRRTWLD